MTNIFQNKNNKIGAKMKRFIFSLLGAFLLLGSFIFVACGEELKGEIQVSSDYFVTSENKENYIELSLNEGDVHTATVNAKVLNANDGRVKVSNNYESIVQVNTNYNASEDQSVITLTAKSEGQAQLILNSWSGSADPVTINVYVYSDLVSLTQKENLEGQKKTQFVEIGKELELKNDKFLEMTSRNGGESNRKDITWDFNTADGSYNKLENVAEGRIDLINAAAEVVATIKDNKTLLVSQNYIGNEIALIANSKFLTAEVNLEVLNTTNDRFGNFYFGRNSTSVAQAITKTISIVRNNDAVEEKEAYIKFTVNTNYDFRITPRVYVNGVLTDDCLAVPLETKNGNEYTYRISGKKGFDPSVAEVKFEMEYVYFDKIIESDAIRFAVSDVVDNIVVTSEEGLVPDSATYELYQAYANGKGRWFNVQLKPDTVLPSESNFFMEIDCPEAATQNNLSGYIKVTLNGISLEFTKNGNVWKSNPISNNSELFIMAGSAATGNIKVRFISERAEENIRKEVNFECVKAPSSITVQEDTVGYLATNVYNSKEFTINVGGISTAQGLYLDYDRTLPIEESGLTYEDGKIKFSITNTSLRFEKRDIRITLCHKNGMKADRDIILNTFIPLEEAKITVDPTTLTGVSSYTLSSGSLSALVATLGSSVKLNFNIKGAFTDLTIEDELGGLDNTWFNRTSNVLFAKQETAEVKTITFTFKGFNEDHEEVSQVCSFTYEVYVPVTTMKSNATTVDMISEDSLSVEDSAKSVQHVIVNLRTDNNKVTYTDLSLFKISLGGDSVALGEKTEYAFLGESYSYTVDNIKVENNQLSFDVHAKSTNGYGITRNTLSVEYTKYNVTFRLALTLNIKNATRISELVWENEVDSIYLDTSATDINDRNFVFITTSKPDDAYNKEIAYKFVPDNGTSANVLSIKDNIVSIHSNLVTGGTGYIYMIPKDAIKNIQGVDSIPYLSNESGKYVLSYVALSDIGNQYSAFASNNAVFLAGLNADGSKKYVNLSKVIKRIRVVVADGQSEETAYRIYSEDQLKNISLSKHYILMNDITLENWASLGQFRGSLSGYVKESDRLVGNSSDVTITFAGTSNPLVAEILNKGSVKNLTFKGAVQDAFVTKENKGTIENVKIDVRLVKDTEGKTKVAPSTVTQSNSNATGDVDVGAIASKNRGAINKAYVYGPAITGVSAGGIVGTNSGTISNSFVELYNFGDSVTSKITGGTDGFVGGLVGKSTGTIENSYVYDYDLSTTGLSKITANDTQASVGAMIGYSDEGSTIKNSFAVVNIDKYTGNKTNEELTASITDSYISYYKETEYTSTSPASRENDTSENWIFEGDANFKTYVNGGKAHLKFYQSNIINVTTLKVQSIDGKVLSVANHSGILMRTNITAALTSLSNGEKNRLEDANKISFSDLFGCEDSNDITVTSSDTDVVDVTSNSIVIKGTTTEEITLTVYSKKDYSKSQEFKFVVVNTISNFKNDVTGNVLNLQVGNTASINYSIKSSIYLGTSKVYDLVQDNYEITAEHNGITETSEENGGFTPKNSNIAFTITGFAGTVAATGREEVGSYNLKATLSVKGLSGTYNNKIKETFKNELTLKTFKGARHIGVSNSQIVIYPSTTSSVNVTLTTDNVVEDTIHFKIVKDLENIDGTTLTVSPESTTTEFTFNDADVNKIKVLMAKKGSDQEYVLTVSIDENYKNKISEEETFYMIISSNSGTADNENFVVTIKLEPQDINHIDMTSYLHSSLTVEGSTTVYHRKNQISSMLSPGNFSYMVIGVDPTYSYYEYITIGAESSEGYYLNLTKMVPWGTTLDAYTIDNSNEFSYLGNSIQVNPSKESGRPEQYIFRVYASKSITQDCIIPLTITFYGKNGEQLDTASYAYNITYQKPAEIEVNPEQNGSQVLAKGSSIPVKISLGKDQTLNREDIGLSGVQSGITIGEILGPFYNADGSKYYTTTIRANLTAAINGGTLGLGNFQVYARVSRFVNGVKEIQETRSTLTLVNFSLSSSTTEIEVYKDAIDNFELTYTFDPIEYADNEDPEIVNTLNEAREQFASDGYYLNNDEAFSINTEKGQNGEVQGIAVKERMYIEEGNNSTRVRFVDGVADCGKFKLTYNEATKKMTITGVATTDEPVRLRLVNRIYTNKLSSSYNEISCYYNISVTVYTDEEDNLLSISSAEDFLNIPNNATAENYILTKDIELVNYTPIDTSKIEMLDGNGYTINITSFNLDKGSSSIARALFSSVTSNTTLKNIRVNYYYGGQINIDVSSRDGFSEIQVAGFAIDNDGIIYNCEVVCLPYYSSILSYTDVNKLGLNVSLIRLNAEYSLPNGTDINSTVAGFVINNTGVITNSRVGGDSTLILNNDGQNASSEDLGTFNIIAQGKVSGFVSQNSGVITSSSANRVQITNKAQNINFFTSGFASSNSGRISTSFVQGTETTTGEDRTAQSLCLNGTSIASNGYIAGFISHNTGSIDNSYSNIAIKGLNEDEKLSYYAAGFVYQNAGRIELSYASCRMEGANISQSNFSGVGVKGESLNTGTIEKCYYNAKDSNLTEDVENAMQTGATLARNPSSETQFYGFSFATELDSNDGIWYIGNDRLLTLTEPNQVTFSHRKRVGTTINGTSKFPYVSINGDVAFKYGGKKNPVIIRSAEEFDLAMGNPTAGTNLKNLVTGSYVNGVYRLVSTVNLSQLKVGEEEINLSSTKKTFRGVLDGNGFTIKNIAISAKRTENTLESVGLFSKIENGSVYNLKLEIQNVTATNSALVGGLAGTMTGNSRLINIAVTQVVPTGTGVSANTFGVKGNNLVGGLVGAVFGEAKITNVSITNPIVQSAYYDETHSIKTDRFYDEQNSAEHFNYRKVRQELYNSERNFKESISKLSFAGGLFGYIDTFKPSLRDSFNMETVPDNGYSITNLKGYNTANIRGEIVGGLVGFAGITSNVKDAGFVFTSSDETTNIISYNGAAGGVFGYTVSIIKQIYAEYDSETQDAIEDNLANYYGGSTSVDRGYSEIFIDTSSWNVGAGDYIENKPEYIGGLIGYQKYGKLIASYSKINVIAGTDGCIAGGVVGRVGNPTPQSAWNENPINNDGVSGTSTTVLLNEVYSSGDVRGVVGSKYTAGGIVGSIARNAKLSLTAVNSVNFFGISEYNQVDYQESDSLYSLAKLEIYALVGERETGAELNSILTLSQALAQQANQSEASQKHIGYVSSMNYKGIIVDILPYKGFKKNDSNTQPLSKNLIEISPLSKITSRKTGYIEMNGYFLNSGNWSTDNWRQDLTDLYPKIKFVEILDVVYLDQYNIDETLILMRSSAKEIRVRGLDKSKINQGPINLTEAQYQALLGIDNFAGRLIGGWDTDGESDLTKIDGVPLVLSGENLMFKRLGTGTVFKNLKIVYASGIDGNGEISDRKININKTGSTFIEQEVNECRFENVTFDYSNVEKIKLTYAGTDNDYTAGLICPSAKSTSFIKVKFKLGKNSNDSNGGSYISVEYPNLTASSSAKINSTKFGLLAGSILQANQYRTMEITEIDVHAQGTTTISLSGNDNYKIESNETFVGIYAGEIGDTNAAEVTPASVNLTTKDIWSDNDGTNTTNIEFNISAGGLKLYLGGYVGKADIQTLVLKKDEKEFHPLNLAINSPEMTTSETEVYLGGMFGSLIANTISGTRAGISTEITYNKIGGSSKVAIGGLIGELGKLEKACNNVDMTFGDISTTIKAASDGTIDTEKDIYLAGLIGNANVSNRFNFNASQIVTNLNNIKDIQKTASNSNTINAFISGGVGRLVGSKSSNLNASITLGERGQFESNIFNREDNNRTEITIKGSNVYTGGMFGKVSAKDLTVKNGKIIHKENISANKSVYAGALGGSINLTGQLELNTKTSDAEDNYTIESDIVLDMSSEKVYVAGLVGSLSTDKLTMTSNSIKGIKGNVTLKGNINDLYAGSVFGSLNATGCEEIAHDNLTISGNIVSDATITTAHIGALAGSATGAVNIGSNLTIGNFTVGKNNVKESKQNPIDLTNDDIAGSYANDEIAPLSAETIYAGGLIGKNSASVSVEGGKLIEETKIALQATGNTYFGGLIGTTEGGNVNAEKFQNSGMFALTNTTANTNFVGGIVGEVAALETTNSNGEKEQKSPQIGISNAFVDANFFVDANNLTAGGIVGHISNAQPASGNIGITNSVFGGAFKVYGENLNEGTHTFGGIVGKDESSSAISVTNNASYGDYIITYTDEYKKGEKGEVKKLSNFTFGGIVGHSKNLEIKGNLSLTTCNNDRIATTEENDKRQAILGASGEGQITCDATNLYSHAVTLTTDDESYEDKNGNDVIIGTDVGYKTQYETSESVYRGYGSANGRTGDEPLITQIKNKITGKGANQLGLEDTTFNKGHKLNPITIGDTDADTTGADYNPSTSTTGADDDPTATKSALNGVTYYTLKSDLEDAKQIEVSPKEDCKLAIVGDARTVSFGTEQTPKTTSYIKNVLGQNEFISSIRLTANIETDSGVNGGLINTMTGGTLYAVAVYGNISVGGGSKINLAPIVGGLKCGLIDESVAGANILYRAGVGKDTEGKPITNISAGGGEVAGFATLANHNGKPITIRNSYSTGRVSTYINATTYGFIDGSSNKNVNVSNCYTISQIDWHDYVNNQKGPSAFNFSKATYTNCWYDVNATECSVIDINDNYLENDEPEIKKQTTSNVSVDFNGTQSLTCGIGWTISKDYNFGYQTRKFGFLKQSSYATMSEKQEADRYGQTKYTYAQKTWNESTYENKEDFMIVPNAGKLAQISSKLDGRYVLTNDLELSKAELQTITIKNNQFSGTLDGQEYTIDYELDDESTYNKPLFTTLSGSVRNLRLMNVNINTSSDSKNIGSLAEKLSGGNIYNVVASGFINVPSNQEGDAHDVGGIVGYSSGKSRIEYCKNYVKVKSEANKSRVGGIIGNASGTLTISNCINYAPIQNDSTYSDGDRDCYTGGIIGKAVSSSINISYCGNTNSVIAGYVLEGKQSSGYVAGGIAGYVDGGQVKDCYNTAMVKAGNKSSTVASYAGGIVGKADSGTFKNLYNAGVIEALGENIEDSEISVSKISIGQTYDSGNTVTFSVINKEINVYADGIIASGYPGNKYNNVCKISIGNFKNDGQIVRNGYYKEIKDLNIQYSWEEHTTLSDTGEVSINLTKGSATCYIQKHDDLGWVSCFSVMVKRTVMRQEYTIVENQNIVSLAKYLDPSDTYYEQGKSKGESNGSLETSELFAANIDNDSTTSYKHTKINNLKTAIVKNEKGFTATVNAGYKTEEIEIAKNLFNSQLLTNGYCYELGEVTASSKNITIVDSSIVEKIKEDGTTGYYLKIGYSGGTLNETFTVSYTINFKKADKVDTFTLKATNIVVEGNNIKLYMNPLQSSQLEEEDPYSVVFTNKKNIEDPITFSNCKYENGVLNVNGAITETGLGENITAKDINDKYNISYYGSGIEKSLTFEDNYTLSSSSDYITIRNKKSDFKRSDTYTTGGQYGSLARIVSVIPIEYSEYINYSIKGNESDSLRKTDGTKYTDTDGNVDRYLYQTGTYGDKIQLVDFPSKDGWVKDTSQRIMSNGNMIGRRIVGKYKDGDRIIAKFEVDCYFNSDAREEEGKIVRSQADGKVLYKIKWSQEEGSFANIAYTNSVPVYVKFVRDSTYGKLKTNGGTVEYPTFETTITTEEGATYEGTQVNKCIYDEDITIDGTSYQTWHYESSIERALTKIEKSYNFTKAKDSIAVYEISDNYGNEITYVDTSRNESYTLNYIFNYSDPASDVELSFKKQEYALNTTSLGGAISLEGESLLDNTAQYTYYLDVDPDMINSGTNFTETVIRNDLVLTQKDNESVKFEGANGQIKISDQDYLFFTTGDKFTLINQSTGEIINSNTETDKIVITIGGVKYDCSIKEVYLRNNTTTEKPESIKLSSTEAAATSSEPMEVTVGTEIFKFAFENGTLTKIGSNSSYVSIDSSNAKVTIRGVPYHYSISLVGENLYRLDLHTLKFNITVNKSSINNYLIEVKADNLSKTSSFTTNYTEETKNVDNVDYYAGHSISPKNEEGGEKFYEVSQETKKVNDKEVPTRLTFKPIRNEDVDIKITYSYSPSSTSEQTSEEIPYTVNEGALYAYIILQGDININSSIQANINNTIRGNNYFINYTSYGNYFVYKIDKGKISDINFAGAVVVNKGKKDLSIINIGADKVSNAKTFGSITSLNNNTGNVYLFGNNGSGVSSFVNYSRFKDDYNGSGNNINFTGISTNYGLIVAFDGADGIDGKTTYYYNGRQYTSKQISPTEGKSGQSIGDNKLTNKGVLKAGNGGLGGRGSDGKMGLDNYALFIGEGYELEADNGSGGEVTASIPDGSTGKNLGGKQSKKKTTKGNTGHRGVKYQIITRHITNNTDVELFGQYESSYIVPTFKVTFDNSISISSNVNEEYIGNHCVWDHYQEGGYNKKRKYSIKLYRTGVGKSNKTYNVGPRYYDPVTTEKKQGIYVYFTNCKSDNSEKGTATMHYFTTIGDAEAAGFDTADCAGVEKRVSSSSGGSGGPGGPGGGTIIQPY